MKGVQILLMLVALAVAARAAAPEPAPEPASHVCVPDKWQGLSFTVVEGKHTAAILAKSAVDVSSQKAASEFIVMGGKHKHKAEYSLGRRDLSHDDEDLLDEGAVTSLGKSSFDKLRGKGVVKVIADYAKEKLYITFHKSGCKGTNVTFCKVKDFEHPMSLSDALCLPERAKSGGTITIGGSLDVNMYFFRAHKAFVNVLLTKDGNIPVSVDAIKKCGKGSIRIAYFNITKEIDEGFFDIPASCPAKEEDSSVFEEYLDNVDDVFDSEGIAKDPLSYLFGRAESDNQEDEGNSLVGMVMDKLASFWYGTSKLEEKFENERAFINDPKIVMFNQA
jgi:hypothetical protein